jgi:hypothetical protein
MAETPVDDISDEELLARIRTIAEDRCHSWYEAYQLWRRSDGDHAAGRELVKATTLYLTSHFTTRPDLDFLAGDSTIMEFIAKRFEAVFFRHPELLIITPKGGRNQPDNVQKAILIAVSYLRRFEHDKSELKRAKSLVADIYGTNIKTVKKLAR